MFFCVDTESREAQSLHRGLFCTKPEGEVVLQDIHKRALRRAAEIIGGNEELRLHLGVSEADFVGWFGKRDLPRDIFLHLVDIITEEQVRDVRNYRLPRKALAGK
jgi:hypothetical protein